MENIYVWSFDEVLCDWVLKNTNNYKGTNDEYNYFRSIRDGTKHFYYNDLDHFNHRFGNVPKLSKTIYVWGKNDSGIWENMYTDLNVGTGDDRGLYTYNTGKNKQYYYSYNDFLDHQYNNNTFYMR